MVRKKISKIIILNINRHKLECYIDLLTGDITEEDGKPNFERKTNSKEIYESHKNQTDNFVLTLECRAPGQK